MEIPTKKELLQLQKLYKTDKKIAEVIGGVSEQFVRYWRRKKNIGRFVSHTPYKKKAIAINSNGIDKICLKCKQTKLLSEFNKDKRQKDGYYFYCKRCKSSNWSSLKQERIKLRLCYRCGKPNDKYEIRDYCESCKVKRSEYCCTDRVRIMCRGKWEEFHKKYPEKNREYLRKRTANDPIFRLSVNLRCRLNAAIRIGAKSGSAVRDLGCSIVEFKEYIEKQFLPSMTWKNWGCGKDKWNLDHIKPFYSIDMTDREQLLTVLHFSNIRPMWQSDNVKRNIEMKNNKYVYEKVA